MTTSRNLAGLSPVSTGTACGLVNGVWTPIVEGAAGVFTLFYESAAFSLVVGTPQVLTHGLGIMPKLVKIFLREVTGNSGFGLGTEVYVGTMQYFVSASGGFGAMMTKDATSITVTPGSANWVYILGTSYTTGTPTVGSGVQADTTANWRVVVRAWA